jgi:hypothetical protein
LSVIEVNLASGSLVLRFDARTPVAPERLVALSAVRRGATLLPDGLRWPLLPGEDSLSGLAALLDRLQLGL